jgi:hypothetical protein
MTVIVHGQLRRFAPAMSIASGSEDESCTLTAFEKDSGQFLNRG